MRKLFFYIVIVFVATSVAAQQKSFRFDFGPGKTMKGYTQVTADKKYNEETGYGFDKYSTDLQSADAKKGSPLLSDYISSSKPFYFSVKLPEGNYDVKVILGDPAGTTDATMGAECRRVMVEKVRTGKGKYATVNFTVHVKDSLRRD